MKFIIITNFSEAVDSATRRKRVAKVAWASRKGLAKKGRSLIGGFRTRKDPMSGSTHSQRAYLLYMKKRYGYKPGSYLASRKRIGKN